MDEDQIKLIEKLQTQHCDRLQEYLNGLRRPDKTDIILACGGSVFVAHNIILQSSGNFFCHKVKNVATNGTVVVTETDPDTLKTVLNFLYLDVPKITTYDQLSRLTAAAHLMELRDLVEYCCDVMLLMLSEDNAFEILKTLQRCGQVRHWTKVLQFMTANFSYLVQEDFVSASVDDLKDLLQVAKANRSCLDMILFGIMLWLKHDFTSRERCAGEIFSSIDATLVSIYGVQQVLEYDGITSFSKDVLCLIKEMAVNIYLCNEYAVPDEPTYDYSSFLCDNYKIVFFGDERLEETFNPDRICAVKCGHPTKIMQVFSVGNMTWHPVKEVPFNVSEIVALPLQQSDKEILMVSGNDTKHFLHHDILTNKSEKGSKCFGLDNINESIMCCFNDYIYLIGGGQYWSASDKCQVLFCKNVDGLKVWEYGQPLKYAVSNHLLMVTESYIFVISILYGNVVIQFNSGPEKGLDWSVFYCTLPNSVDENNFFVYQNTLSALHIENRETVILSFDPVRKQMCEKRYPVHLLGHLQVHHICLFPLKVYANCVYVSTDIDRIIPDYVWYPETGVWVKLDAVKGQNEILKEIYTSVKWVYVTQ